MLDSHKQRTDEIAVLAAAGGAVFFLLDTRTSYRTIIHCCTAVYIAYYTSTAVIKTTFRIIIYWLFPTHARGLGGMIGGTLELSSARMTEGDLFASSLVGAEAGLSMPVCIVGENVCLCGLAISTSFTGSVLWLEA